MSEGNWSENGCHVGVSSAAQCNSQHFGTQWESKIGLSENNLHRFGAGVDVEVQTLKMAFFWEEKKRRGREGICLWWEVATSRQEQRALFAGCALRKMQISSSLSELPLSPCVLGATHPASPAPKQSAEGFLGFVD